MSINKTLENRGIQYGTFKERAEISIKLKNTIREHAEKNVVLMPGYALEAIDMICHKLSRIVNGNPLYIDSWRDIAGYAQLVVDILKDEEGAVDVKVEAFKVGKKINKG